MCAIVISRRRGGAVPEVWVGDLGVMRRVCRILGRISLPSLCRHFGGALKVAWCFALSAQMSVECALSGTASVHRINCPPKVTSYT